MKKQLAVLLVLIWIAASAAACGGKKPQYQQDAEANTRDTAQVQTEAPKQAPTEAPFQLILDDVSYSEDAEEIRISSLSGEVLEQLPRLKVLKQVTVTEGGSGENLEQLRTYCDANGIAFRIELAGQSLTDEDTELTLSHVTENQLDLLALMPNLQTLHFPEPEAPAEHLRQMQQNRTVTWEKTVLGMTFSQDARQIDLTSVIALDAGQVPGDKTAYDYGLEFRTMGTQEDPPKTAKILPDHPIVSKWDETAQLIEAVEQAMPYFPEAEEVLMCGAMMDDEAMAQFRENHREDYKVVWSVVCGDMAVRTDATFFMPTKYYVPEYGFSDLSAYNLRYCEDMISIDLGHMVITDLEFARYMPELKYLVLALDPVKDLSPLSTCKKLVFLEMHWCDRIEDFSPLLECTALEDLNIGETFGDITPVLEMTWLKNLWLVGCEESSYNRAKTALPDTNIAYYLGNPDDGWRELPNYYAMRDELLMFYMQ